MNQEPKDRVRIVTFEDDVHRDIRKGVDIMRKAVGSTYGPGGRNVLIKKKYIQPIQTRDGVTVAREIGGYGNKLPIQAQSETAKLIYQAAEKTNKTAGDGTTATVVLLSDLYKEGYRRITAGDDPMVIKRLLDANRDAIVKYVQAQSVDCTKEKLDQVAYISSGDKALGQMVSDLVYEVGADGAISISYQNAPNVEVEKVTGYAFGQGFRHLAVNEVELTNPMVFVAQKRLASKEDIIPLLELSVKAQRQFVIVGDVAGAALETLVWAISNQKADGLSIIPPAYGADGYDFYEDIATYTGSRIILEGDAFKDVDDSYVGSVKSARISRDKATLFGDNSTVDAIEARIKLIKEQLEGEMTPSLKETLEQRYAKLAGKVSIIKVGAVTEVEREELFFRVEDAVEACKSALSSGVVAGGATTLLHASQLELEPFVSNALQGLFRLLLTNMAEDAGDYVKQILRVKYGKGFDLRNMTDKPVDLLETGIVDPTKVVLQTVKNAFSVAGVLLTTGTFIGEEDEQTTKA